MNLTLTGPDWAVFAIYGLILGATAYYFSLRNSQNSRDFFLAGNAMPVWMVAISTLATTQSAATFLGGPDLGYRSDFSYIFTNLGAVIAALIVARFLIPLFYQQRVTTVYELLQNRFGANAKRKAGGVYLLGRIFASGARLYMAAIAVSMLLFGDIQADHVVLAVVMLAIVSLGQTVFGGVSSVIQSDVIQCFVYVGAAIAVFCVLMWYIPVSSGEILTALANPTDGSGSKLELIDWRFDLTDPFTLWATFTGFVLLNVAAFGLDQDVTQRVLTCRSSLEGARAMLWSVLMVIPVMALFMGIGMLLYVYYQRPDLMGASQGVLQNSADVTVFMQFVLNELPGGVRGLVVIGVIAAALSTLTSGLNSMASVITEDFYRPWAAKRKQQPSDAQMVRVGRLAMIAVAAALSGMAILCFYWQQVSQLPLLPFALSVMVFAYSGLLGVFFTALFTGRGNGMSVTAALIGGFCTPLVMQPWLIEAFALQDYIAPMAFPWQLCIGTLIAFGLCCLGKPAQTQAHNSNTQEALA
ncbi:sodium:solute symporter [Simiduia sp. 21SJ11W-1]|uniref:sodium:solute symporter n=1 Tax=Simiduia sp. 21SJ11W-1 TaxID=2909669 RepID=UPI00209D4F55|nr:sodium:solute symporter [Simiduia sp. 21SJ11W-1]UTA48417.1 sodium:solute symporter [Simiduia sp. 21SJ11W-1]